MKELCEPSVKELSLYFSQNFHSDGPPPNEFQELTSWLTYVGPPQSVSTDDILANLCLTALPLKK